MLTCKFPLYALRANFGREEEAPYVLIVSRTNKYVLDMPMLQGDYAARRLQLLQMELDYPVYPLKERFTSLAQVVKTKRKEFIDADGKVWKKNPRRFYKIKSYKVLMHSRTWDGKFLLQTAVGNFVYPELGMYVTVVETNTSFILFDVGDEPSSRERVKI